MWGDSVESTYSEVRKHFSFHKPRFTEFGLIVSRILIFTYEVLIIVTL